MGTKKGSSVEVLMLVSRLGRFPIAVSEVSFNEKNPEIPEIPPDLDIPSEYGIYVWTGVITLIQRGIRKWEGSSRPATDADLLRYSLIRPSAAKFAIPADMSLKEVNQSYVNYWLDAHNGNKNSAAKSLGVSARTVFNKTR